MIVPPAIALLEFDSIAIGTLAADAMIKKSPVETIRMGTVQPGKYIVLVGGSVAAVDESRREGLSVGGERVTDEIFLPDVHPQVFAAIQGERCDNAGDSLGIIETSAIPVNVAAADKAIKTAAVTIVEIRLGDGLGGKGVTLLTGLLHDVQAAIEAALAVANRPRVTTWHSIVPIQHGDLRERVQSTTRYYSDSGVIGPTGHSIPTTSQPDPHTHKRAARRK